MTKVLTTRSILIVDDNPTNLEVLAETLTDSGFQVSVALDGETALEQVQYYPPELILLDIMMPGIDGFETCRRLKESPATSDIPVIFLTALSDTENKVSGFSLGAVDYITKPFHQEEVLARVRTHLKLHNLTRTLEDQNVILKQEITHRKAVEDLLQTLNQELERRVEERTLELSRTLQELEQAQVQLVHSDRMSSLGQLVAGVAHEINNPVNFIYGNLSPASEYTQDLLGLAEICQKHFSSLPDEIQEYIQQIDLNFLQVDLPKLVASMKVGADRIRQIILSLRNFSRLDEAEVKSVDIHEGIESTLLILQNRLKVKPEQAEIQVVKNYGNLPEVECYAGQLNQVFMNILSNAIDALDGHTSQRSATENRANPGRITITTEARNQDWVLIRIADNGPGMTEAVKKQLFDPFFTTKPIGKGTGLGMSISYQIIVENHKGKIGCDSEPGRGAEFCIEIPISADYENHAQKPIEYLIAAA
jgi:signal transduction histidine kinase